MKTEELPIQQALVPAIKRLARKVGWHFKLMTVQDHYVTGQVIHLQFTPRTAREDDAHNNMPRLMVFLYPNQIAVRCEYVVRTTHDYQDPDCLENVSAALAKAYVSAKAWLDRQDFVSSRIKACLEDQDE